MSTSQSFYVQQFVHSKRNKRLSEQTKQLRLIEKCVKLKGHNKLILIFHRRRKRLRHLKRDTKYTILRTMNLE